MREDVKRDLEYGLLDEYDADDLSARVNENITQGWRLHGTHSTYVDVGDVDLVRFTQAMIRGEE